MTGHIIPDRAAEIADGKVLMTSAELAHIERCPDCLDVIPELIRARIRKDEGRTP